jgi:hypothetical protein
MGIGVIAILTLFPLGAFNMANAVREDRSAQMAAAADGYFRAYWKTQIVEPYLVNPNAVTEPFFVALNDPNGTNPPPTTPKTGLPSAANDAMSYPVFVDPMGYAARPNSVRDWVGDGAGTNVPRRSISLIQSDPDLVFRVCSQWDGIGWDDNSQTITKDREVRYNWLAVIQRLNNGAAPTTANFTVVVFDRRIHLIAKAGDEVVSLNNVTFTPQATSLTIPGSTDLKAGQWVMDGTVLTSVRQNATGYIRHANFYRVVSAEFDGLNTQVELQTPILMPTDGSTQPYAGTLVILRGVSGVYARRVLAPDN